MTLNDFIIDNNCKNFKELKERLCNKYAALRVKMKGVDYSYLFSLNPKVDNDNPDRYLSDEWVKTINNVTACTFLHEINGMYIESIEPVTKDTLDAKEVALLFAHEANVFDDTFDFQVKYGLMSREEMFEKAPYFIEKDNLMMKIGHLKEELAEIEKAAENDSRYSGVCTGFTDLDNNKYYQQVKELAEKVPVPLALHGGSGTPDDQMQNAIRHGITKINIYSDVVGAMNMGLKDQLNAMVNPATWPFLVFADAREMMKDVVRNKLRTFGSAGRL